MKIINKIKSIYNWFKKEFDITPTNNHISNERWEEIIENMRQKTIISYNPTTTNTNTSNLMGKYIDLNVLKLFLLLVAK